MVHYAVANMPGAVALTSTKALTSTTLPFGLMIADLGLEEACKQSKALYKGVNLYKGKVTYHAVAQAFGMDCVELDTLI